jgi:hypothetical protein
VIAPGDVSPRRDSRSELYVAKLSNAIHRAANTGPTLHPWPNCSRHHGNGRRRRSARGHTSARTGAVAAKSALDEPIGAVALREAASIVTVLISQIARRFAG